MDLKRHVQDLRDNIRTNWSTTGQELSKELRQFWPASRPDSPARPAAATAASHGSASSSSSGGEPAAVPLVTVRSPGGATAVANQNDFISGYALGLVGGVRSWVRFVCFVSFMYKSLPFPLPP